MAQKRKHRKHEPRAYVLRDDPSCPHPLCRHPKVLAAWGPCPSCGCTFKRQIRYAGSGTFKIVCATCGARRDGGKEGLA